VPTTNADGSITFTAEEWDNHVRTVDPLFRTRELECAIILAYRVIMEGVVLTPSERDDMIHEFIATADSIVRGARACLLSGEFG
jgi:hypothetical protein